jgi:hypothetical protein
MTSPSAIVLAGAGAAVAIVAGAPILAPVAALAAWGARVAFAVPKAPKGERPDPFALSEPWRFYVREAMQAAARYERAVRTADPGPLRERLVEIGRRVDEGVQECWRIAKRGDALEDGLRTLDVAGTQRELATAEEERAQGGSPTLDRAIESLRAQVSSAERMHRVAQDARDQLRLLDARLDEAVTRAVELSLQTGRDVDLTGLGSDVDTLVLDMEALRQALEETSGTAPSA